MEMKFIVIVGHLECGIQSVHGPFETLTLAKQWAFEHVEDNHVIKRLRTCRNWLSGLKNMDTK